MDSVVTCCFRAVSVCPETFPLGLIYLDACFPSNDVSERSISEMINDIHQPHLIATFRNILALTTPIQNSGLSFVSNICLKYNPWKYGIYS